MGANVIGTFEYNSLLGGDFQRVTGPVVLRSGPVYPVGSVLGLGNDGKCGLADSAATDGGKEVYGILTETVDATDGDKSAIAFLSGEFLESALTFGGSDAADVHRKQARMMGIYFKPVAQ